MSAIMQFAIFPIDKGDHIGEYVSKVINFIKVSGLHTNLGPMEQQLKLKLFPSY